MSDLEQTQSAAENSYAIQSGGDTTVNTGVSPEQMTQLMHSIVDAAKQNLALADDLIVERLKHFEERIYQQFAEDKTARMEAFREPDFKYVLMKSCEQYARFGDEFVCDALVGLIVRRSKETKHGRLSLSLNDALQTAGLLTKNEFAELSMSFLLRYTGLNPQTIGQLAERLRQHLVPLLDDVSEVHSSYAYLESRSCARIDLTEINFEGLLKQSYGGLFSKGFEPDFLKSPLLTGLDPMTLFMPCLNDPSKVQLAALSKSIFQGKVSGLAQETIDQIYGTFAGTLMSDAEILAKLADLVPEITNAAKLWNTTPLKNLILTTLGQTIGHANLSRNSKFDGDLSIWIQ